MTEEQIQAYVMGELLPEEAALVAEAVAQDPNLAALAKEYEQIATGFRQQRVTALQQELLAYDKTLPAPPTSSAPAAAPKKATEIPNDPTAKAGRLPRWPFLLLAATIVIGSLLFLLPQDDPVSDRSLSEQFYVPPGNPRTASNQSQGDVAYQEAITQFFADDYANAHIKFTNLATAGDSQTDARFYLPHASFSLGKHDRADTEFQQALADPNMKPDWVMQLRWNAMINNLEQGEDISEDLAKDWGQYSAEALRKALREQEETNQ